MNKFFNTIENIDKTFPIFSTPHIIPLLIIILLSFTLIINIELLKKPKNRRTLMITIALLVLSQQILISIWYSMSNIGLIKDGLPFYLCRIVNICIIYSFLTNTKSLNFIIFFIGSLGSVLALIIPDTSGYLFPHIMYIQFFIIHGSMFLTILFLLFIDNYRPDKIEFKKIICFIFSYSALVSVLNSIVKGNYGYLESPPKSASFFALLPPGIIYKLGMTSLMCTLMLFVYILFKPKSEQFKFKFPFTE